MLGDDSTHSMNMIPLRFHQRVANWKVRIDGIRALDENMFTPDQKWSKCLDASHLFLEFSPEFLFQLRAYRDDKGCFDEDVVDVIMGVHGKCSNVVQFVWIFCSDSNGAGHAAVLRESHATNIPPPCVPGGIPDSYNPFITGAHYTFSEHGRLV